MTGRLVHHHGAIRLLLALACVPTLVLAQTTVRAATNLGLTQAVLQGVVPAPVMTVTRTSGLIVTATSTANVRSNVGWRLQVTLTAPVATNLTAKVEVGRNRAITLSPTSPSAVIANSDLPCASCPIAMTWTFSYRSLGRNTPPAVAAPVTYTVLPAVGAVAVGGPVATSADPAPAKDELEPDLPTAPSTPSTPTTGTGTGSGTGTGTVPSTPTPTPTPAPTTSTNVPADPRSTPTTTTTPSSPATKPTTTKGRIP